MDEREQIARLIADEIADGFDNAFASKAEWIDARGHKGGRARGINEPRQSDFLGAAEAILAAGYRKQPTIDDAMVERAARATCREKSAFYGEPPCFRTGDWPNPLCNEPGCRDEARAALRAALEEQP